MEPNGIQEVDGSIPFSSTNEIKYLSRSLGTGSVSGVGDM
jgi:hypothetical protein